VFQSTKQWARKIKRDVVALWIAARDPRVPWYAKAVAAAVTAYALSPIDLIPDFVPVLGYFDDIVIVPLGILFAVSLIPHGLMDEFRAEAASCRATNESRCCRGYCSRLGDRNRPDDMGVLALVVRLVYR
jgi:uncharacterized membrane protein YkvA (DUF1232 family)